MIPIQILRVLSTIQQFDAAALLMGGQACVLYGAAEYSRDLDLAVLADSTSLARIAEAMQSLDASVIAVPQFSLDVLSRGHAVHFSVPDPHAPPLRVDIMSRMRGVDSFEVLWSRRTSVALTDEARAQDVVVEMMALEDLVAAKKTQRDKDWPMIRRLVDASYVSARDEEARPEQIFFWLDELRSPEFLIEAIDRFPDSARSSTRGAVLAAISGGNVEEALAVEQSEEMQQDRAYWAPLRRELELLRHEARKGG